MSRVKRGVLVSGAEIMIEVGDEVLGVMVIGNEVAELSRSVGCTMQ